MTQAGVRPPAAGVSLEPLFQPLTAAGLTLPNRFAMAPMTRCFSPHGVLPEAAVDYYARRARGGCGLILTEGVAIPHPVAAISHDIPNLDGESLPVWRRVVEAVHAAGSKIFLQAWHTGLGRFPDRCDNPETPSVGPGTENPFGQRPVRAMTQRDIDEVVEAYGRAAVIARDAGFDGINLHGAHGYLIDQFLWTLTNDRADGYNSPTLAGRARFALEVIGEMRRRAGPGFPIMLRFSQWKLTHYDAKLADTPQELESLLVPLAEAGVDMFDASTRRFWLPEFEGSDLNLAGWAKKLTGKPAMTIGSVGIEGPLEYGPLTTHGRGVSLKNLPRLVEMFERGDFDLVGVGRSVLLNPEWPNIARRGDFGALRPFDPARLGQALECAAG